MTRHQFLTAIVCLMLTSGGSVLAAVYKTIDAQGNVVYTDEPQGNAKPVDLPPLSTIPPPSNLRQTPASKSPDDDVTSYEQVSIITPTNDETMRDNTGNVAVSVAVKPALDKSAGHRIQFFLDGQTEGEPKISDRTVFQGLDRGAHTVEAAVVDGSGKELLRSPATRFYLHRQSVNFPRGPGQPTPFAR
jgi:Domain of unknown function (DUF4124)